MSEITEKGKIITGYKATNGQMMCRDHKFKLGEWYEVQGELEQCSNGFHFCEYMSGVWAYYSADDTRVFKVEAEEVLLDTSAGADIKHCARRIRLVEEIKIVKRKGNNTGDRNTGNWNTGNGNTGNWNTGDGNTGNWNTGYRNTGDRNTGDRNTGNWNTGNWNTGNRNTGNGNTGYWNTGNWNTGDRNTGNWNTGDGNTGKWNTGDGNTTDYCSGFFCQNKQYAKCFDKATKLTVHQFRDKYWSLLDQLGRDLAQDKPFDYEAYKSLPNWTLRKIKSLHKKHIEGRKK